MTTVDTATVAERVSRGVAWLDLHVLAWWRYIDLGALDISRPCRCVLGQIYGDFYQAPIRVDEALDLGFDAGRVDADGNFITMEATDADYKALAAEWSRVIEARRTGTP